MNDEEHIAKAWMPYPLFCMHSGLLGDCYPGDDPMNDMDAYRSQMPPQTAGRPDDFQTPPIALEPLLPYIANYRTVWECAAGMGNLSKHLADNGHSVIATDLLVGPQGGQGRLSN